MFDAVFRAQICDALFDVSGETLVSQNHICPHRIATHFRTSYAPENRAERRVGAPRRVTMPGVFVRVFGVAVEQQQFRMVRITGRNWVVLEVAEATCECDMSSRRNILI